MAARKASGAVMNSGNDRRRSSRSSGRPCMVEAVKGEGRTGLVGLVSAS